MDNINGTGIGQVRKYDLGTGAETILSLPTDANPHVPSKLANTASTVLALDGSTQKVYEISITGTVAELISLAYAPGAMQVDDTNVWVSSSGTVYKYHQIVSRNLGG
jgi:hypothetical protein